MDAGPIAFYVVAVVTLAASLGAVVTRSVVYGALLLVASLMLTGLVYLLLLSDFLALVQILVYGGTVSVLLLFALMLTRPQERPILNHRGWPLAALAAIVLFAIFAYQSFGTAWSAVPVIHGCGLRSLIWVPAPASAAVTIRAAARIVLRELGITSEGGWGVQLADDIQ